jgi:hypothetical protein
MLVESKERGDHVGAIELPARRAELEVERRLVGTPVSDVAEEPGGLPLLSTALLELWDDRDERLLRYESYRSRSTSALPATSTTRSCPVWVAVPINSHKQPGTRPVSRVPELTRVFPPR